MLDKNYLTIPKGDYQKLRQECTENKQITEELVKDTLALVTFCVHNGLFDYGAKILDIGCGNGANAIALAIEGFEVFGIDISPTAIERAVKEAENRDLKIKFLTGNMLDLPFGNDEFDFVLNANCFNSITQKGRKTYLKEIYRVLKRNGVCLFICKTTTVTRYIMIEGVDGRYLWSPYEIIEDIKDTGFRLLHSELEHLERKGYFNMMNIFARKR